MYLPKVGTLWTWKGNNYDVMGIAGNLITLREHGSNNVTHSQLYDDTLGKWQEPDTWETQTFE